MFLFINDIETSPISKGFDRAYALLKRKEFSVEGVETPRGLKDRKSLLTKNHLGCPLLDANKHIHIAHTSKGLLCLSLFVPMFLCLYVRPPRGRGPGGY